MQIGNQDGTAGPERRKSLRLPVHWTVYLAPHGVTHPLRSTTKDLSRGGFYCYLHEPVTPGDQIECDIVVPTHYPKGRDDVLCLRCRVNVVRVEKVDCGQGYGLACRIDDYSIINRSLDELLRKRHVFRAQHGMD
jgi:PilZ domain-containing protein